MNRPIPIIDLFAGPGGLGEGFAAYQQSHAFKVVLSIEKDFFAHQTLLLRSFYRQFQPTEVPNSYFQYLRSEISLQELKAQWSVQFDAAENEAWHATLGETDAAEVSRRVSAALGGERNNWLLIGGPPCQAYSVVGRSRIIGKKGKEAYDNDKRHFLYREYLRIIATHQPAVFIMENVKGLLSATVNETAMFPRILDDLSNPFKAWPQLRTLSQRKDLHYRLYPVTKPQTDLLSGIQPEDFIVCTERYGIPQARHRVIIVGIRDDFPGKPGTLAPTAAPTVRDAIGDLPKLRSGLSVGEDSPEAWKAAILRIGQLQLSDHPQINGAIRSAIRSHFPHLTTNLDRGGPFIRCTPAPACYPRWYACSRLGGVCNHETRAHIPEDLHRYFYAAVFAASNNPPRSPRLVDFPEELLPNHKNVVEAVVGQKFNDRFRVQLPDQPSTTVVSHIAKDGHYYIHYDPAQCRSLTVREAARLQTFPDSYFFEGGRTQQYFQVGNAVPPLLAHQIAAVVYKLFLR